MSAGRSNPARPRTLTRCPCCAETSVGLPFFQIEGTVVEWRSAHALNLQPCLVVLRPYCSRARIPSAADEVKFDVRLMQRVPYEGVSRMQTSLRRKHRDRVVRRGLALIIESDFVRSRLPQTPP